jgi:zinc D-Ala-D-Ala dipeptidase
MNMNSLKNPQLRLGGLLLILLQLGFAQEVSFRITPLRPVEELRAQALKQQPPSELGTFLKPDLAELVKLDPTIKLDIRYATSNNFLGTPVYTQARAFLERPAAEALFRVHLELKAQGYGLIIHDGYRPWYVTKIFWDATPDDKKIFVANPAEGSRHNRGCAVDLSLYDLKTGKEVEMTSGYDEMTDRAFADYPGGTADERFRRDLLRQAMEKQDFKVYDKEWWHFDYKGWKQYPILNVRFEDLRQ